MKVLEEMPTSGQFAMVWTYNGKTWCSTLRWNNDVLEEYQIDEGEGHNWMKAEGVAVFGNDKKYIVIA